MEFTYYRNFVIQFASYNLPMLDLFICDISSFILGGLYYELSISKIKQRILLHEKECVIGCLGNPQRWEEQTLLLAPVDNTNSYS